LDHAGISIAVYRQSRRSCNFSSPVNWRDHQRIWNHARIYDFANLLCVCASVPALGDSRTLPGEVRRKNGVQFVFVGKHAKTGTPLCDSVSARSRSHWRTQAASAIIERKGHRGRIEDSYHDRIM